MESGIYERIINLLFSEKPNSLDKQLFYVDKIAI